MEWRALWDPTPPRLEGEKAGGVWTGPVYKGRTGALAVGVRTPPPLRKRRGRGCSDDRASRVASRGAHGVIDF